ncbi:MAG: carboxypeptidase-like regulatory domain-containing protein [Blastopirellula sp. JB062]
MLQHIPTYIATLFLGGLLVLLRLHSGSAEPAPATVEGVVTYLGQPVDNAFITFKCRGMSESLYGQTDEEGRYELYSRMDRELPIGKYAVTIVKRTTRRNAACNDDACSKRRRRNRQRVVDLLPEHYGEGPTSGLIAVIEPGANVLDFKLDDELPESAASDPARDRASRLSMN